MRLQGDTFSFHTLYRSLKARLSDLIEEEPAAATGTDAADRGAHAPGTASPPPQQTGA